MVASDSLNENYTSIIINVKDVNDMPPVFPETLYEKTFDEEVAAPYMMIQVVFEFISLLFNVVEVRECESTLDYV